MNSRIAVSYTIGEVADAVGLSVHALRWYEQVGLLDPIERDTAGRRRYSDDDLGWLRFLVKLRSTGMPVREMVRYLELARGGPATDAARLALLRDHRDRVLAQIDSLREDLKIIEYKISHYVECSS